MKPETINQERRELRKPCSCGCGRIIIDHLVRRSSREMWEQEGTSTALDSDQTKKCLYQIMAGTAYCDACTDRALGDDRYAGDCMACANAQADVINLMETETGTKFKQFEVKIILGGEKFLTVLAETPQAAGLLARQTWDDNYSGDCVDSHDDMWIEDIEEITDTESGDVFDEQGNS